MGVRCANTSQICPAETRALAIQKNEKLTRSQMLMAANAPILAKRAMNDGDPVGGYLPSGSVAGVIDDRPSCAELVQRIMTRPRRR